MAQYAIFTRIIAVAPDEFLVSVLAIPDETDLSTITNSRVVPTRDRAEAARDALKKELEEQLRAHGHRLVDRAGKQ